jgi:hypothetical protein
MSETQQIIYTQIRLHLEHRLAQRLKAEREALPALSMLSLAELVSLLFMFHGHQNVLGGFGESMAAVRALVGDEQTWARPKLDSPAVTIN